METKEIKIQIPEGYEIDKEKSTFERIVFKKKTIINSWEDLEKVEGYYINNSSCIADCGLLVPHQEHKNIFLNEKYAKSALAIAQISQLLPYYDANVDWSNNKLKWCVCINKTDNEIIIDSWQSTYHLLAFNTIEEAERFLKHNEQLVKDYYMI